MKKFVPVLVIGLTIIVLLAVIGGALWYVNKKPGAEIKELSGQEVAQKVVSYINGNFLTGQPQAVFKTVAEESGMYKIQFTTKDQSGKDQNNDVYATKDGRWLFPTGPYIPMDLDKKVTDSQAPAAKSCEEITKADNAALQAFIVSRCRYGLQMQRILAEDVKNIPSLKSNIKVRYIGSVQNGKVTSMHDKDASGNLIPGGVEAQENLRQICLREETNKYWDYVSCYIKKGESENCLNSAGVDKGQLDSCMTDPNKGLKYAEEDFALADQFSAQASPALILNNEAASEYWFGGRTADAVKTLICCGLKTESGFCSQILSKDEAAIGFSETYTSASGADSGNDGSCNQ